MSDIRITIAEPADEPFLWTMLYHAAQMDKDGAAGPEAARGHPYLDRYVAGWGRPTDLGVIGLEHGLQVGAVWSRLLIGADRTYGYIDDQTPELAAAMLPAYLGRGIGTRLMAAYLELARAQFPAVALNVRADNPALRLYQRAGFEVVGTIVNRVGTPSYNMLLRF